MKITATADLHGWLPPLSECDLLLIGGDVCPDYSLENQLTWLDTDFRKWLESLPARKIIGVWGNHDFVGQKCAEQVQALNLPWTVLTDELTEFEGVRIYGTPWSRTFYDWAFMLPEPELDKKYEAIPECDIILSHGPTYAAGDYVPHSDEHVGSQALLKRIIQIKPKLVITGHIHCDSGQWQHENTTIANVTLVNNDRTPAYNPHVFNL